MQKYRAMNLVLKLVLVVALKQLAVNCDLCIPSRHRVYGADDMKNVFGGVSLTKNGLFRSAVLNKEKSKLIVGGRDSIAVLDATTLKVANEESWTVDNSQCLSQNQSPKDYCNNYITHLSIYKDNLVACGTGSLKPVYKVFSMGTMSTVKVVQRFGVCASPNPNHNIVGQITSLGEMIAGTFFDVGGLKSEVVGSYMTEKMTAYRENLETTVTDISKDLEFIRSFYIKDSVYVFFMEAAEERDNEFTATIGRFCQTDNGAQAFISSQLWTTFRKTRLSCQYEGEADKNIFKYLVDVVYDEKKKLFYATYMMTRHVNLASAICTFTFEEIESSFNNNRFLTKDQKTNQWTEVNGPPFLDGCSVNKTYLESGTVQPTSVGKEPTDSLNIKASTFMRQNRLMALQVYSKPNIFQYVKPATRFTKMTLDKVQSANGNEETIINVVDDEGNILTLHPIVSNKEPCVIEEIQTGIKNPRIFIMNVEKRLLYISGSTYSKLHAIDVDSCHRYNTKTQCLGAKNIRCGWSVKNDKCMSTSVNRNLTLLQNITNSCPMRTDIYSSWSPWKAEKQQDGSNRYCLTRQRECHSCDKTLCDQEHVEVTNCSANEVTDVQEWLVNGSVDGSWSNWEKWSTCQLKGKCGNATMIRYRSCSSPAPSNGGRKCLSSNFECSTCPKEKDVFHLFWSEWGSWTNARQTDNKYRQQRTRICSKPNQCHGKDVEYRECPTSGILWGEWSECTCQLIQHRFPLCISGCGENCLRLKQAEYRICQPVGCPTTTPKNINTTSNETDTKIEVLLPPKEVPIKKCQQEGYTFQLIELISIGIGIIASCFVIVVVIVLLLIRRDRKKNNYSPEQIRKTKSQPLLEQTDTLDSNSRESNA